MEINVDSIVKNYPGKIPEGFVKQVLDRGIDIDTDKQKKDYICERIKDHSIFDIMNKVWEDWIEPNGKDADSLWNKVYNVLEEEYNKNTRKI